VCFFSKSKSVARNACTNNSFCGARRSVARSSRTPLLAGVLLLTWPTILTAQDATFKIPPQKIPFTVKDQQAYIVVSATVSMVSKTSAADTFRLQLTADLTGLQENLTPLLSAQLDKDDRCGERIAIQQATLTPASPAATATVQLHYERFACVKAFGKQQAKRIVAGNAVVPIRLTPAIEQGNTQLRLNPEVGEIQADGSFGELLRSARSAKRSAKKSATRSSTPCKKERTLAPRFRPPPSLTPPSIPPSFKTPAPRISRSNSSAKSASPATNSKP
jgi:hypothetical protein